MTRLQIRKKLDNIAILKRELEDDSQDNAAALDELCNIDYAIEELKDIYGV